MKLDPKNLETKSFFETPLWIFETDVKEINKCVDPYIAKAKKNSKQRKIPKYVQGQFNNFQKEMFYDTPSLLNNDKFRLFNMDILRLTYDILDECGYDLKNYNIALNEIWAREFVPNKAASVFPHCHKDSHLTGVIILKSSKDTSKPFFYDPRQGKYMKDLPEKEKGKFSLACDKFSVDVKPGMCLIFPSFLSQSFGYSFSKSSFRYLHFVSSAVIKNSNE